MMNDQQLQALIQRAEHIPVGHETLSPGCPCPECGAGTVYLTPPGVLLRFVGQAPLQAKVYQLEKLRCNLCGRVFTAAPPSEAGDRKYDATAASMIGLLKYGTGMATTRTLFGGVHSLRNCVRSI